MRRKCSAQQKIKRRSKNGVRGMTDRMVLWRDEGREKRGKRHDGGRMRRMCVRVKRYKERNGGSD